MKRHVMLIGIAAMLLAALAFTGCQGTEGPSGPAGPAGTAASGLTLAAGAADGAGV